MWLPPRPRPRRRARLARAAAALLVALPAPAPPSSAAEPFAFVTERLADGVYAVRSVQGPGFGMDANSTVLVGPEDVIVVDAQFSEAATQRVIREIRRLTPRPVRHVVSTHWHDDHVSGNAAYARAYPGVVFVAHEQTARDLPTVAARNRTAFLRASRGTLALLADLTARRRTPAGAPASDAEVQGYHDYARLIALFAAEADSTTPLPPPALTVGDRLTLRQGRRRIDLLHLGRGHTAGDLVVHLPAEGIVVAGDLVIAPVPFVGSTSYPHAYGATLERLLALPHRAIVPGHGAVLRDDAHVRRTIALLRDLTAQVDAAVERGDSLPQLRERVDLAAHREAFGAASPLHAALFDTYVAASAIPRAYEEARAARAAGATGTPHAAGRRRAPPGTRASRVAA